MTDDFPYEHPGVTKMPKSCPLWPCCKTPRKAKLRKNEKGFMECPLCKRSY